MRGTTRLFDLHKQIKGISTHVPHAGHDRPDHHGDRRVFHFNSRAPCGARQNMRLFGRFFMIFQLTCPMRGTTKAGRCCACNSWISTHVPHAGHDLGVFGFQTLDICISTHVPHAGHDCAPRRRCPRTCDFNSRAPCGARLYPRV